MIDLYLYELRFLRNIAFVLIRDCSGFKFFDFLKYLFKSVTTSLYCRQIQLDFSLNSRSEKYHFLF